MSEERSITDIEYNEDGEPIGARKSAHHIARTGDGSGFSREFVALIYGAVEDAVTGERGYHPVSDKQETAEFPLIDDLERILNEAARGTEIGTMIDDLEREVQSYRRQEAEAY